MCETKVNRVLVERTIYSCLLDNARRKGHRVYPRTKQRTMCCLAVSIRYRSIQESPVVADKPARRESMPKLLQFDVLTTLSPTMPVYLHSFNYCWLVASEICEIPRNSLKIQTYRVVRLREGHSQTPTFYC